jgi:hypothetical protein
MLTKNEAQAIIDCYNELERNVVPEELINEAYSYIPGVNPEAFQRVKIQQIRRFVVFNQDVLNEAMDEIIPEEIDEKEYKQMNSDDIIQQIENETYGDDTPEERESLRKTKVISSPKRAAGRPRTKVIVSKK